MNISVEDLFLFGRSTSKISINKIQLPKEFFTFMSITTNDYNYEDCYFVTIDPIAFFEGFKFMEIDKKLIMKISDDKLDD